MMDCDNIPLRNFCKFLQETMSLKHDQNFTILLTSKAMVEFNTRFCHEESILIEKKPYSDDLFVKVAASKEKSEKYSPYVQLQTSEKNKQARFKTNHSKIFLFQYVIVSQLEGNKRCFVHLSFKQNFVLVVIPCTEFYFKNEIPSSEKLTKSFSSTNFFQSL